MTGRPVVGASRRSVLAALALLGPAAGLSACGDASAAGAAVRTIPPGKRRVAPTLVGTTLTGTRLSTASWAGKPIVVNVWGSWCQPCRDEAPALATAATKLMAKGVEFLGLNTRESGGNASALAYVSTYDIPYPSLVDTDGSLILALSGIVSLSAIPSTAVLDARHRVAAVVNGGIGGAVTLEDIVDDATSDVQ